MLSYQFAAIALAVALSPVVAQAQDAPAAITAGAFLRTADGKRAGQIFSVDKASDGAITGAALIGPNSVLVHVPIATITAVDKSHFTTSMNYRDIFR